jgi:TPR repeat protein
LYRLSADQGSFDALVNLGVSYASGDFVDQDPAEAARLYRLAADQGFARAQYWLGVCYEKGFGIKQDPAEAARLYRLAADQGFALAQQNGLWAADYVMSVNAPTLIAMFVVVMLVLLLVCPLF